MGIQFYNGLSSFANYDLYKRDIPQVNANELNNEENVNKVAEAKESIETHSPAQLSQIENRSNVADLENISLTFNKEESFDYIGSDASIKSLDMQKAISDMKKDSILEEYQYFVGNSKNLYADADGIVIPK